MINLTNYVSLDAAVEASLKIWKIMAQEGFRSFAELPLPMWKKQKNEVHQRPLCHFGAINCGSLNVDVMCVDCPLNSCDSGSNYQNWCSSESIAERKHFAEKIIEELEEWQVSEEMYAAYVDTGIGVY